MNSESPNQKEIFRNSLLEAIQQVVEVIDNSTPLSDEDKDQIRTNVFLDLLFQELRSLDIDGRILFSEILEEQGSFLKYTDTDIKLLEMTPEGTA